MVAQLIQLQLNVDRGHITADNITQDDRFATLGNLEVPFPCMR